MGNIVHAGIGSVHEKHGNVPLPEPVEQVSVRRILRGAVAFENQAVHAAVQHTLQDVPLRLRVVVCRAQRHHRARLIQFGFNSLQDRRENIVRNIGRNHADLHRSLAVARSVAYICAAAPAAVHQAVILQQCNRLPDSLSGYIKTKAKLLLRHQRLSVTE